jgi:hypothetical protein
MEHLAMFENSDDRSTTTDWGQQVTDEEYHASRTDPHLEPTRKEH